MPTNFPEAQLWQVVPGGCIKNLPARQLAQDVEFFADE
jgi:hypothetical protein